MKKRRGFTLIEVMVGSSLTALLILYSLTLLSTSLRSMQRTDARIEMSDKGTLVIRKISEELRSAFNVTVSSDGRTLSYSLPKFNTTNDLVTGEKEYTLPMQSDGVTRNYSVNSSGQLRYWEGTGAARTVATGILLVDPDPASTKYNETYLNFQLLRVGTKAAVRVTLLTQRNLLSGKQNNRMTVLTLLRNAK